MKFNRIKRFAGVLFLLGITFIFYACGDATQNISYTFDNQSSYGVSVTLSELYKTKVDYGETTEYIKSETQTLSVYSGSQTTVYVDKGNVDFSWTASYESDNKKIYCEVNGGTAVFKNR